MVRYSVVVAVLLGSAVPARASAESLFDETSRDFGAVARGAVVSHPFRLVNNTSQRVVIHNVRVSCGCTTARALHNVLNPGQESAILVNMDTRRFTGNKGVFIYVTFSQPHFEEVRLWVQANSRDDLALAPSALDFGKIRHGTSATATVTVTFLGGSHTEVTEARSESNYLLPACKVLRRDKNEVSYQLAATLRKDAPPGKWFTDLWLKTNNPALPKVRVPLAVEIDPPLVNPIALGQLKKGAESTHKLVVRGGQPFLITSIKGGDGQLQVRDTTSDSQNAHVLTLTLRPSSSGEFSRLIQIRTDLASNGEIFFTAQAKVVP
jgi:hypothetical protein